MNWAVNNRWVFVWKNGSSRVVRLHGGLCVCVSSQHEPHNTAFKIRLTVTPETLNLTLLSSHLCPTHVLYIWMISCVAAAESLCCTACSEVGAGHLWWIPVCSGPCSPPQLPVCSQSQSAFIQFVGVSQVHRALVCSLCVARPSCWCGRPRIHTGHVALLPPPEALLLSCRSLFLPDTLQTLCYYQISSSFNCWSKNDSK